MRPEFILARNSEAESKLPFLLFLPVDGGLWLKTKETWPRASRLYCHPAAAPVLRDEDVLERVLVTQCERRGPAIDLILARGVNKRSQFIFTTYRGRPMIFWQTPKTAAAARPGLRVPIARASADAVFCIDTRERYGYAFKSHGIAPVRRALACADYAVERDGRIVGAVERKSLDDVVRSLVDGTLNFALAELCALPCAAVVVEASYSQLLRHEYTRAGFLADLIARLQVRYPSVPLVFVESRKLGEEWTFRFLRAAHANAGATLLSALPAQAPRTVTQTARRRKRKQ
jgi:hypothetical protein